MDRLLHALSALCIPPFRLMVKEEDGEEDEEEGEGEGKEEGEVKGGKAETHGS